MHHQERHGPATVRLRDDEYAPFGLIADAERFGLTITTVSGAYGSAVARSRRTNRSTRATIFLHGAAGSWTTWTPLLQSAEESGLAIGNPILLDLPGWGDATLTGPGEGAAVEAICSLVKDAAEDLGFTEWDLVGHSMGGFIAMHMAAIWPQSVLSVGTISATGWSVIGAVEHPIRRFVTLPGFVLLLSMMRVLARLGRAGRAAVRGVRSAGLLRFATSALFRFPSRMPASVIAALADEVRPREFTIAAEIARGYDASGWWSRVECPVRAVQGDHDAFCRRFDLEQLASAVPDSYRSVLPRCGHFALIERPREVLVELGFTLG